MPEAVLGNEKVQKIEGTGIKKSLRKTLERQGWTGSQKTKKSL